MPGVEEDMTGTATLYISLTRRRALELLAASVGTALVAGCVPTVPPAATSAPASAPATAPTSAPAPASQATAEPRRGGTMRAAIVGDLTSIDGQQSLPGVTGTVGQAYEGLTRYDDKLQPQPLLAESWDLSVDGKQIKVNLRKGVQFHDGRELTSDDVRYSLLRVRDPQIAAVAGQLASQSAWWTGIDTPDKSTIVLTSDVPRPGVFDFFQ